MNKLKSDLQFKRLLITKSLECAENSTGGVRDMMLNQAARLEQEAQVLQDQIDAETPKTRRQVDSSIPTLNITVDMGSKSKPAKKSAPRSRSKKISKAPPKKKVSGSRRRAV